MKSVFVTVGTTSFDDLIFRVTCEDVVKALIHRGYTDMVLQVGRGSYVPDAHSCPGLRLQTFRFKESIAENIQDAHLVISHAECSPENVKGSNSGAVDGVRSSAWTVDKSQYVRVANCGAGSCLEVLGAGTPLLVVVNDKLMDNHQLELAKQLQADGHLLYCTCSTLAETLSDMDLSTLLPFQRGQPENFAQFLDKAVGFV